MASSAVAKRPLRVLCCSGSLEGGGSERQLWQLASKLDRQRFSPSVYLLYRRGHYIEQLPEDVGVTAFWSEFDEGQRYWPGQIRRMQVRHLAKAFRDLKIDVVYDRTFHMTLVTAAAATRARVPRVSVIVSPPSADFQKSREGFRYFKKRLLAAAYRQPGCVTIAVSDEVADDAAAFYGVNRSLIRVLPNPVDLELVQALAQRTDSSYSSIASGTRIIVVGRLSREKGQRLALEALQVANSRSDKHIHLDVVGDGPDRAELERTAQRLGIGELVTFHGFVSNPYPMIQKSHLLCIPSEYEGLPNVALEAMVLGTAVVATDCSGSLRTLIGDNERGVLVPQGSAEALAQVFVADILESSEFERRRTQALQWVAQHHGLPAWLGEMETTLSSVVKPPFDKFALELD
ncbi:MAG: glycosyltransferase [Pirellulaceae bacterium]|nr:glycosyltransferase [Pirellulaceae bacterium]